MENSLRQYLYYNTCTCTISTKIDNIEIMTGNETDEIIEEFF